VRRQSAIQISMTATLVAVALVVAADVVLVEMVVVVVVVAVVVEVAIVVVVVAVVVAESSPVCAAAIARTLGTALVVEESVVSGAQDGPGFANGVQQTVAKSRSWQRSALLTI